MGGPTGEVHLLSPQSGSFLEKVQEVLFVPPDKLADTDKSRKALRYGSHAIEFAHLPGTNTRLAFVPVLGTNSIEVYTHDPDSGFLTHVYSSPSPRFGVEDGPRHVKVHPNDLIRAPNGQTTLSSISTIHRFRGDTLMLGPSVGVGQWPTEIWATTRGATEDDPDMEANSAMMRKINAISARRMNPHAMMMMLH
ncbi:muconate cycloisomerase 1 [Lentinula edodes]|uniref:Muconate cycloisomerase 1 n=1 Tax=Lentinula edodes TaxID=5353 RepID=A0A1Q3EI04_LENED|nr:muconate cycloisomerase 1 [Lentinula edodes]